MTPKSSPPSDDSASHWNNTSASTKSTGRAVPMLGLHDPPIQLYNILKHHELPRSDYHSLASTTPLPRIPFKAGSCLLKYDHSLLPEINGLLVKATELLTPRKLGPDPLDLRRLGRYLAQNSNDCKLKHNHGSQVALNFIVKALLQPVNDLMSSLLLPIGCRLFWRLGAANFKNGNTSRPELVWKINNEEEVILCIMAITTPNVELQPIDNKLEGRVKSSQLTSHIVSDMTLSHSELGVMTNCNAFITFQKGGATGVRKTQTTFNYSPEITVSDTPHHRVPCRSPLGLLFGIAVLALSRHGVDFSSGSENYDHSSGSGLSPDHRPTTSVVLKHALEGLHHFDSLPVSRHLSYPNGHKRGTPLNPNENTDAGQLGGAVFTLQLPPDYPHGNKHGRLPWPATFYGLLELKPGQDLQSSLNQPRPDDFSWIPNLQVQDFIGKNEVWHAWTVRVPWANPCKPDVAVCWSRVSPSSRDSLLKEANILSDKLVDLQGKVVPRLYGVFGAVQKDDQQWCALIENPGWRLPEKERSSQALHNEIRSQYERLHQAGIVHNNVKWRHILYSKDRPPGHRAWITGFSEALVQSDMRQEAWTAACKKEMANVGALFGPPQSSRCCLMM